MGEIKVPKEKLKYIYLGAIFLAAAAAWWLSGATVPFLLGLLGAYVLNPLVEALVRLKFPRPAAVIFIMLLIATVAISILIPLALKAVAEFGNLTEALSGVEYTRMAKGLLEEYREKYRNLPMPDRVRTYLDGVFSDTDRMQAIAMKALDGIRKLLTAAAGRAGNFLISVTSSLATMLTVPVIAMYILFEFDDITKEIYGWVPTRFRQETRKIVGMIDRVFSGFFRGQLLVCTVLGTLMFLGLTIMGLKFSLVVGILAGLANIVPYLGAIVGIGASFCVALLTTPFGSPLMWALLKISAIFAAVQGFDNLILSPKVIGDSVDLHPLTIMFALLAGASAAGALGMVVAVPLFAVAKVLWREYHIDFDRI